MENVLETVISQWGNSPTILQLIQDMDQYIDPCADIDNFYDFVWNVDTAQGFGLDIWGRIVNVGRTLNIPTTPLFLGFSEGSGFYPFGQESFYSGIAPATQAYSLSDSAYRTLILAKALANISATTAPCINQLLQSMFGNTRCYCNDLGNMQFRYTFEFSLTAYQFAIVTQSGVFPRPGGVGAWCFQGPLPLFGFSEAGAYSSVPFGQSVFIPEGVQSAIV